tara:strand:+ start:1290 stop:2579 length:1290 start_codon:yes stop_codon:yes gene_type:complete
MSKPTLTPKQQTSVIVLPSAGDITAVAAALPLGVYRTEDDFLSGAADQVAYTYKKLGGDILDIEITEGNIYANYEEAVLEYSYIVNSHQAKNVLSDLLGTTTGSFDSDGTLKAGDLKTSLSGTGVQQRFPRFEFAYARRISDGVGVDAGVGGNVPIYSASFSVVSNQQDYNLQTILSAASTAGTDQGSGKAVPWAGMVGNKKVEVRKVYYKTPNSMWRFYGYYGGLNAVGNLSNYGQYSDDSTFEVIPTWQNKLQAAMFEDAIYTRNSHFSYELRNNLLRLFPTPNSVTAQKYWFEFTIPQDPYMQESPDIGIKGVNNMNTLPFENIPFVNINSMGKQWIRRYTLALSKETLGQVRSKFGNTIPIPGESVSLNGDALLSQAKEEQNALRDELIKLLEELTYTKLAEDDKNFVENAGSLMKAIPLTIFVG